MRTATIRTSPSGIDVSTPYESDFVDALKATVPSRGRKWDSDRKMWTITPAYIDDAVRLLEQYFHVVDLREEKAKAEREQREREQEHQQQQEQERQREQHEREQRYRHGPYATLHLQPTAPPELIHSAWRCLAKLYHPDHGGNLSQMQKLNAAYEELRQR
jgi:hypothetical protein